MNKYQQIMPRQSEFRVCSKVCTGSSDICHRCTYRFVDGPSRTWASSAQSHYERSDHHPTGLVKQAYSAWVSDSVDTKPRKWHLTAYFTYADLPNIPVIDQDPLLRGISVPAGVYKSGKARSRTSDAAYPSPPSTASVPSRPSSPYRHGSANAPTGRKDQIILPSLQSAIAQTQMNLQSSQHRPHGGARLAEDQRIIQMLNSRHIM